MPENLAFLIRNEVAAKLRHGGSMKREAEDRRNYHYYAEGNTVRQLEPMPDYRLERKLRQEREQEEERRRKKREARRKQEKALRMGRSYVGFLTLAVAVFGAFTGTYIMIQSDVTARLKNISKLESQISDLRAENDEAQKRISTTIDLDRIRETAINEYGMFYATPDQIIYYTIDDDDYMNQYSDIPEK